MTLLVRSVAAGLALGFFVGLAPSCGANKPCGSDTCAGCCDSSGACIDGSSDSACGSAGSTCVACESGRRCSAGFCSATAGGDGGTGAGGGAGGGGGMGGGTGGGSPGDPASAFVDQLAAGYCGRSIACGFSVDGGTADCEALVRLLFADLVRGAQRGSSALVAAASSACVSRVSGASCAGLSRELSVCFDAFGPVAATRSACVGDADCVAAADRCAGPYCTGTCQTAGTLGAPCRSTSCDHGLYCELRTVTCQPTVPPGRACPSSTMCNGDGVCTNGICVGLPQAGALCDVFGAGARCAESAYCSGLNCVARKQPGVACVASTECVWSAACVGGRCVARGASGATCASTAECLDGLTCDTVLKQCGSPTYAVPRGGSCTRSTRFCRVDSQVCAGQAVGADGGVTTAGSCRDSMAGDPCVRQSDCNAGLYCSAGSTSNRGCQPAALNTPCASAANCRPTEDCIASICQPRISTGASCATAGPGCLDPAAVCVVSSDVNGALQCRRLGALGDACRTGTASCQFPAVCEGGTCVLAGHPGQPCLPFWGCLEGVCLDSQGGLGTAPTGSCAAPRATGAACLTGANCASGTCDTRTGTCIAACQ